MEGHRIDFGLQGRRQSHGHHQQISQRERERVRAVRQAAGLHHLQRGNIEIVWSTAQTKRRRVRCSILDQRVQGQVYTHGLSDQDQARTGWYGGENPQENNKLNWQRTKNRILICVILLFPICYVYYQRNSIEFKLLTITVSSLIYQNIQLMRLFIFLFLDLDQSQFSFFL